MLATQTADGDLRVWSVSKPPTVEAPRVIRVLKRSDTYVPSRSWISWSKNGRIVQFSEGKTWAWDVRTKHVTYEPIPTVDGVRAIACHGPTGTLFTLGPDFTVQQYDVERALLVANVRHLPLSVPPTPPEDARGPVWTTSESEEELASPLVRARGELRASEAARTGRNNIPSPQSALSSQKGAFKQGINDMISPAGRTEYTTTSFDTGIQSNQTFNQVPVPLSSQMYQPQSPVNARAAKKGSRLRQEVVMSPEERVVTELFPYTRARLHDVPYRPPRSMDDSHMTPDDLRTQMLSVVFGWEADIQDLVRDELSRQPSDSQNAIFLAKWLDEDSDHLAEIMGATGPVSNFDWMLLALGTISNQVAAKKITQVFIEKMLSKGDIHAAATLMLALGDMSDAIEVYVSRNQYMEAVLLTCLVTPDDWQRQSYLVRRWGEHVVENSQQSLAIRCFSCTGVEPSDPWTSPKAQQATKTVLETIASPISAPQIQTLESMEYPAIFQKTLERRRTLDAPTPVAMPPPHIMQTLQPPTPFRTAAAQGTRITPQTSALKLVTSFGAQSNTTFKFPGLKPEDRTPTVAAAVTPIAESAIDRSALSPGGLGSYRLNNIRSINSALSAKTATPGGFQPSRLTAIGETPVDVEAPQFPSALPQRSVSVPAELTSAKSSEGERAMPAVDETPRNKQAPLTLLTSARYEPSLTTPVRETPQTAVGPQTAIKFPAPAYDVLGRDDLHADLSRSKIGSRSRKPDGLSIHTGLGSNQDFLPASSFGESISRPATTGSYPNTQLETGDLTSPPTTGQSYRNVKSPLRTGRSIDQYISSLEQAQYYSKHARARGYSNNSKQSRDEQVEGKRGRDDEREARKAIPPAKRSPTSPVPMSPEDLRMYSTSVESFESMYSSNYSGIDRSGTPASLSKLSRRGSQSTAKGTKPRKRSHSRHTGTRSKTGSRQQSPDPNLYASRGRSSSRKENMGHRSPSSPRPMVPSEEDRQSRFDSDSALRLVSRDRHRLHRSTSRQPARSTSARRDRSPDRRKVIARSRSRQPDEVATTTVPSLGRKSSRNERHRRHRRPSDAVYDRSAHPDDPEDGFPSDIMPGQEVVPRSTSQPQFALDRGRAQTPAEQLEARRQSLTRRPSVPNVPIPSQVSSHGKSASTGHVMPPLARSRTDDGTALASIPRDVAVPPELTGLGVVTGRPATPRAMQVDATIPESDSMPATTAEGSELLLTSDVYRPPTRGEDISRPGSTRAPASLEFLSQIPKHPAYDRRIVGSRSSSKGAEARASSRSRATSRDRTRVSPREPVMASPPIGTTEAVVYASPAPAQRPNPPILPELQHLAEPPPPPPPPPPPAPPKTLFLGSPNLANLRGFETSDAANIPLPMSAIPASASFLRDDVPNTAAIVPHSANAASSGMGHRRGRSGHDSQGGGTGGSSGGQLFNKLRNFTARNRSPSRGRKGDDNQAMSPRLNGMGENLQPAPYESIPSAMMGSV
jgi:hypothetical protein